jgi:hypothetical protein
MTELRDRRFWKITRSIRTGDLQRNTEPENGWTAMEISLAAQDSVAVNAILNI